MPAPGRPDGRQAAASPGGRSLGALDELGDDYAPDDRALATVMIAKRQVVTEAVEVVDLAMEAVGGSRLLQALARWSGPTATSAPAMFHPLNPEKTLLYAGRTALGQPVDTIWSTVPNPVGPVGEPFIGSLPRPDPGRY